MQPVEENHLLWLQDWEVKLSQHATTVTSVHGSYFSCTCKYKYQQLSNHCSDSKCQKSPEKQHGKKRRCTHRLAAAWDVAAGNSLARSQRPQCTPYVQDVSHREKNKQTALTQHCTFFFSWRWISGVNVMPLVKTSTVLLCVVKTEIDFLFYSKLTIWLLLIKAG